MNENEIAEGKRLLLLYAQTTDAREKEQVRNAFHDLIFPYEIRWIKHLLQKRGKNVNEGEIISLSWDCFMRGFRYYKPHTEDIIPFYKHFYTYARFHLLDVWRKQQIEDSYIDYDVAIEDIADESDGVVLSDALNFIQRFRDFLPEQYKIVLEDALLSLVPATQFHQRRVNEITLSKQKYDEAKRVFSFLVTFILKQEI